VKKNNLNIKIKKGTRVKGKHMLKTKKINNLEVESKKNSITTSWANVILAFVSAVIAILALIYPQQLNKKQYMETQKNVRKLIIGNMVYEKYLADYYLGEQENNKWDEVIAGTKGITSTIDQLYGQIATLSDNEVESLTSMKVKLEAILNSRIVPEEVREDVATDISKSSEDIIKIIIKIDPSIKAISIE
jgi:hypothetical protein